MAKSLHLLSLSDFVSMLEGRLRETCIIEAVEKNRCLGSDHQNLCPSSMLSDLGAVD